VRLDDAYAHCARVTRSHPENFPVGSLLAPRRLRRHLHAVYAFARAADDLADEAPRDERRLAAIDAWEASLDRCLEGRAEHPVFVALGDTIRAFGLPDRPFRDLLDAFRQDCRVTRYASWEGLLDYCRRSANPVGRIVLRLYGHPGETEAGLADSICTALQLTNFWQDVAVDLAKDRIYLPAADRRRWGVADADLAAPVAGRPLRSLILEMVARTRRCFAAGRPLPARIGGRLGVELRAVWLGGSRILDRIEAAQGDVLAQRPTLSAVERATIAARAFLGSAP
jgi:phytoene synthase